MVQLREITISDAKPFLQLQLQLDKEASYMLYEPGERTTTVREQRKAIADIQQSPSSTIFVAEHDKKLIGYLSVFGSRLQRIRHVGYITIGILEDYCNQGLGRKLLEKADHFAQSVQLHRLELTVIEENARALHVYQKCGYEQEGVRRRAIRHGHKWLNEIYMGKLL